MLCVCACVRLCVSLGVSLSIFLPLTLWSRACYHSNLEEEVMLLASQKLYYLFQTRARTRTRLHGRAHTRAHTHARIHTQMLLLRLSCTYSSWQAAALEIENVCECVCPVQLVHAGRQKHTDTRTETLRDRLKEKQDRRSVAAENTGSCRNSRLVYLCHCREITAFYSFIITCRFSSCQFLIQQVLLTLEGAI